MWPFLDFFDRNLKKSVMMMILAELVDSKFSPTSTDSICHIWTKHFTPTSELVICTCQNTCVLKCFDRSHEIYLVKTICGHVSDACVLEDTLDYKMFPLITYILMCNGL